ncbi:hypothetical protein [Cysteiniphilum sp. 6C5]
MDDFKNIGIDTHEEQIKYIITDAVNSGLKLKIKLYKGVILSKSSIKKGTYFNNSALMPDCRLEDLDTEMCEKFLFAFIQGFNESILAPSKVLLSDCTYRLQLSSVNRNLPFKILVEKLIYQDELYYCYDVYTEIGVEMEISEVVVELPEYIYIEQKDLLIFEKTNNINTGSIITSSELIISPALKMLNELIYDFADSTYYQQYGKTTQQQLIKDWLKNKGYNEREQHVYAKLISTHYKIGSLR